MSIWTSNSSKAHRFFQSSQCIPSQGQTIDLESFKFKIANEGSNLYSLFDLIIIARTNQLFENGSYYFFRRLMTFIYCIIENYQLYYSKIQTLTNFWEDGCMNAKQYLLDENSPNLEPDSIEKYRRTLMRQDYLLYTFRCFNSLVFKHLFQNSSSRTPTILLKNHQQQIIKKLSEQISLPCKKCINSKKYESQQKILLAFQYSRYLLVLFRMNGQDHKEKIFNQFVKSLLAIIRLLKKFYVLSFLDFRGSLNQLILLALKIFSSHIPLHKLNLFMCVVKFLNRKQQKTVITIQRFQKPKSNAKITKMLMRILKSWRDFQTLSTNQNQLEMQLLSLDMKLDKENVGALKIFTEIHKVLENNKMLQCKQTSRKIYSLKKRRAISLRLNKLKNEQLLEESFVDAKRNLVAAIKEVKNHRSRILSTGNSSLTKTRTKQEPFLQKSIESTVKQKLSQKKKQRELRPLKIGLKK